MNRLLPRLVSIATLTTAFMIGGPAITVSADAGYAVGVSGAEVDADICPDFADVGPISFNAQFGLYYQTWKGWIAGCGFANISMHGEYVAREGNGTAILTDRWPDSGEHHCTNSSSCSSPSISTFLTASQRNRFSYGCATFWFFVDTGPTEQSSSVSDCNPPPTFSRTG